MAIVDFDITPNTNIVFRKLQAWAENFEERFPFCI